MPYITEALNMVIFFLPSGVAIQMTEAVYVAPSLNAELTDAIFLQNLPSIVASYVLDPQPGEIVLDMCAAPGIKHYCTNDSRQTLYHTYVVSESFSSLSDLWLYICKKGIVISTSHLLSEFQMREHITCMDSKFCEQIG